MNGTPPSFTIMSRLLIARESSWSSHAQYTRKPRRSRRCSWQDRVVRVIPASAVIAARPYGLPYEVTAGDRPIFLLRIARNVYEDVGQVLMTHLAPPARPVHEPCVLPEFQTRAVEVHDVVFRNVITQ